MKFYLTVTKHDGMLCNCFSNCCSNLFYISAKCTGALQCGPNAECVPQVGEDHCFCKGGYQGDPNDMTVGCTGKFVDEFVSRLRVHSLQLKCYHKLDLIKYTEGIMVTIPTCL